MAINSISWAGPWYIAVDCHMNPSLSEYLEIDFQTGKTVKDLLGGGFTRSPDSRRIAYVGPLNHFAPPYRKSNYLWVDGVIVYPLPKGAKAAAPNPSGPAIDVVRQIGSRFTGIHEFPSPFYWSPDSQRIAFVDCTSDWIETGSDDGGGSQGNSVNNQCSIAVVALNGTFNLIPPDSISFEDLHLSWKDNTTVQLTGQVTKTFDVP